MQALYALPATSSTQGALTEVWMIAVPPADQSKLLVSFGGEGQATLDVGSITFRSGELESAAGDVQDVSHARTLRVISLGAGLVDDSQPPRRGPPASLDRPPCNRQQ